MEEGHSPSGAWLTLEGPCPSPHCNPIYHFSTRCPTLPARAQREGRDGGRWKQPAGSQRVRLTGTMKFETAEDGVERAAEEMKKYR
ncbi:unnamed protein product [Protopolystoma xenopodis]|uniref:Uncharacterized protein n=1 Tax=Protopolystoma xenopodis TaxID=117903 RepID=A0A448WLS0_9PLAT|nr:unnamed protein product [Protopolystoma xenopodis]